MVETAQRYPEVFATVGVHPHGAASLSQEDLEVLARLAAHPKVVAVGEIGLDFYRRRSPEKVQEHWFREQLALAHELRKSVVIHTREATAATLRILQEDRRQLRGGVMHCFQGSLDEAQAFLDLGLFLSFSGTLTFPKAEPLRRVARQLPLDRVLVETDCPYLAPQPWRGQVNEPAYVVATAATLAELARPEPGGDGPPHLGQHPGGFRVGREKVRACLGRAGLQRRLSRPPGPAQLQNLRPSLYTNPWTRSARNLEDVKRRLRGRSPPCRPRPALRCVWWR